VQAQSDQDSEGVLEEVIVTGVKYSMTEAVEIKRQSMDIVDSIVSEDIGKFPDNNVVEAMQRIPGVQVTGRGAGEASTVSIRGLSEVTTTVNGRNIFTSSGRSVALADIPATLVNRVDVYKTRSASQIARGIAGQIDIHTFRPFDFEGFKVSAQARGTYQEQADKFDPNLSALISNVWETDAGKFGALFNASWVKTHWLDQGVHAGASVPFRPPGDPAGSLVRLFPNDPGTMWTTGLEHGQPTAPGSVLDIDPVEFVHARDAMFQPHVNGTRERPAWNLSLQWAPNDSSEYTFEAFYNGFRNDQHNGLFFTFVDWWGAVDPADPVVFHPNTNVVKSRYVNFPYEFLSGDNLSAKTDSYLYALGGKWDFSDSFTLRSEIAYQDSKFEDQFFALRLDKVSPRLFVDFNTGSGVPYVEFFDNPNTPQDESDLTDASQWNLAQLYDNGQKDSGDAFTWTADADYAVEWGPVNTLSFGVRWDDRSAEENGYTSGDLHCNAAPGCAGTTNADYPGLMGVITNHFDGRDPVLTSWADASEDGLNANMETLRAAYGYAPGNMKVYDNEFNIDEKQLALYLQADFAHEFDNGGFIDGRFGARWLDQKTDMTFPDPDTGGTLADDNSNTVWLPTFMFRWGITEDLLARFSYTETFNLPTFVQLNPYTQYFADVTNIGYGTATGGNPDLEPITSNNYDISLEWYFAEGSVLYATWFKRDITGNIVNFRNPVIYDDPDDNPDRGAYTYILSQPDNAGDSTLDGWEFGLTWFPELPGWFNGLGIQGSLTILDSQQEIPTVDAEGNITGIDILPIFGVSDTSYSAILAYDRDTFSARLSWFWRDSFIDRNEAALFANPLAIYKSAEESLDFQATWMINDMWALTFDATNLTDPVFHENYGDNPVIFNHLNNLYSRTYSLGVRFTY
jgi:TonB-dependent receptor